MTRTQSMDYYLRCWDKSMAGFDEYRIAAVAGCDNLSFSILILATTVA